MFNNPKHIFINRIERKISANLGISSLLATFWTSLFTFSFTSHTRRILDEKHRRKIHYTFLKKTVYITNYKKKRSLLSDSSFLLTVILHWDYRVPVHFSSGYRSFPRRSFPANFSPLGLFPAGLFPARSFPRRFFRRRSFPARFFPGRYFLRYF